MLSRFSTRFASSLGAATAATTSAPEASRIVSVQNVEDARTVHVEWADGVIGRFPYVWLRDCSPDPKTYTFSAAMKARNLTMRNFDVSVRPVSVSFEVQDQQNLLIQWPDGQNSRYDSNWLRLRNPSDEKARQRRRKIYLFPETTWSGKEMRQRLPTFDYSAVMNDDKALHGFLEAVCLDGIARLVNGPKPEANAVDAIGRRIGLIQTTHFGRIFEVATKADASNQAYATDSELPFHTDFPSLSDPPQLQMLHMLQRAETGGLSLFVDGFHVAEQLRRDHPDAFSILSRLSAEYVEEGYDTHEDERAEQRTLPFFMCARHKVIQLDDQNRVVRIQFGNAMRSWFYDVDRPEEDVQKLYDAMKLFTQYCYRPDNVLDVQLENGDTVLWANTRLLHTRSAFKSSESFGPRTLRGCYFAWDLVKSRVRQLQSLHGLEQAQPSA